MCFAFEKGYDYVYISFEEKMFFEQVAARTFSMLVESQQGWQYVSVTLYTVQVLWFCRLKYLDSLLSYTQQKLTFCSQDMETWNFRNYLWRNFNSVWFWINLPCLKVSALHFSYSIGMPALFHGQVNILGTNLIQIILMAVKLDQLKQPWLCS